MATLKNILPSMIKFQVGQGDNIQFWHANWVQRILKYEFPYLFANVTDLDTSVASQHVDSCWKIIMAQNSSIQGRQELVRLMTRLQEYTVTPCVHDKPLWRCNESGLFSIASAYRFMMNSPHITTSHKQL
jgi:hypothetical protein